MRKAVLIETSIATIAAAMATRSHRITFQPLYEAVRDRGSHLHPRTLKRHIKALPTPLRMVN